MSTCWSLCVLLLGVCPCLTYPLSDVRDVTGYDVSDIRPGVSRKMRKTGSDQDGDTENEADLVFGQTDRRMALESALDRLFVDYLHETSKRGSPQVDANEEMNKDSAVPNISIDFRQEQKDKEGITLPKRYYFGRRCNLNRLSRKSFVELIKTGKLCGRRVAAIRFGLTGR